jgi:hypothetical protein
MDEKTSRDYNEELQRIIGEFRKRILAGTSDPDNFLTITKIERLWSELKCDTDLLYTDMLSELLSNMNESELIRKKKLNIEQKE